MSLNFKATFNQADVFLQKNFVKNIFSEKCWNRKIHSQVVGIDSDPVVGPDF